ncbi:Ig-like domain-containing protein [Pantoea eucrina]|uniref:Ig-like domain-containing protein n=1 Tax=Pantoea eucrina TaxID=472693 RepID=A0ABU5LBI1_9GAMM|nr:Ig-like domain-containing protein [Pantoea eucrina]MDZ7277306.1 Ig-like domain-containing protein [Pantoea eucrina]
MNSTRDTDRLFSTLWPEAADPAPSATANPRRDDDRAALDAVQPQPERAPPTIRYALDDVGTVKGELDSGSSTDDFSPTLVGRAEPNSIVYLFAQNKYGGIGFKGSVKTDSDGNWVIQSREMISGDGLYSFHASYTNSKQDYRPDFVLNLASQNDPVPQIAFAHDNSGDMTGKIYQYGTTDDKTPTLEGRGAPGSVVEVQARSSCGGWRTLGSVKVDAQGNWQFPVTERDHYGEWSFRARGHYHGQASSWSENFTLIVIPEKPQPPTIEYLLDDQGCAPEMVFDRGITDDSTPVLNGTGVPGQVIEVEYILQALGSISARQTGSTVVGEDGTWQFSFPTLYQQGSWVCQARASTGELKSAWTATFSFILESPAPTPQEIAPDEKISVAPETMDINTLLAHAEAEGDPELMKELHALLSNLEESLSTPSTQNYVMLDGEQMAWSDSAGVFTLKELGWHNVPLGEHELAVPYLARNEWF